MSLQDDRELFDLFAKPNETNNSPRIAVPDCGLRESDKKMDTFTYVQWTTDGKIFFPAGETCSELTPGVYEIRISERGIYFQKIPIKTEGLIRFPDSNSDLVINELEKFWEREDVFNKFGLLYKRGIMLYGPPGSGKSCTVRFVMENVIARGGIVVKFTEPELYIMGMRALREIQPSVPVVTTMEDIDSTLERFSESAVLNILDGVDQINKVIYLATTNYPDKLGARIINRPSRFDKRFKIGHPSAEGRRMYFEHIIKDRMKVNIDKWVEDTEGMSIAHLRELVVAVIIIGDKYEDAISTLKLMHEIIDEREYDSTGFHTNMQVACRSSI